MKNRFWVRVKRSYERNAPSAAKVSFTGGFGGDYDLKKVAMKLLILAHVPPPHDPPTPVKWMLDAWTGPGTPAIQCFHVNAPDPQAGGCPFPGALRAGVLALWYRFRYGVTNLYYVPSSGGWSGLKRDWLVLRLCRPFYQRIIFHWQTPGLSRWLELTTNNPTLLRTYQRMGNVDLAILDSEFNRRDAEKLTPKQLKIIPCGGAKAGDKLATAPYLAAVAAALHDVGIPD